MRVQGARARSFAFHRVDGTEAFSVTARTEAEALRAHLGAGGTLAGLDLSGRTLRGLDLGSVDLTGSLLRNADLRGCQVAFARFDGADLSGADLAGVVGTGVSFAGATLGRHAGKRATLDGADIDGASFRDARLSGTALCRARIERADFSGASVAGADLREARLGDAEHGRADYRDCDFSGADLRPLDGAPRRGVTRTDRTVGTRAVSNRYEGARLGDAVPAFAWDDRLSRLSRAIAVGLAGAAVAGGLAAAGTGLGLAHAALGHAVDLPALADRLEALVHYRHVADLLAGTAPARWAAANGGLAIAAVVSGAVLLRDKAMDKAKEHLAGHVRKALDAARPLVADVVRRTGNLAGVVAAVTAHPGVAATLVRSLRATAAPDGGTPAPVRDLSLGGTEVIVCTADNLHRAMERIATGLGPGERPAQDVLLVRDRGPRDAAPVALRLHAAGGMTAIWSGPDGIRSRGFAAERFLANPGTPWIAELPADGPDAVRSAFENAILRDHLPGLDVGYRAGRGRVEFGDGGLVRVFDGTVPGNPRAFSGRLDEEPSAGPAP